MVNKLGTVCGALIISIGQTVASPVLAAEWGYSESGTQKPQPAGLSAPARQSLNQKNSANQTPKSAAVKATTVHKPAAPVKKAPANVVKGKPPKKSSIFDSMPSGPSDTNTDIAAWMSLFQLASKHELSEEEKNKLREWVTTKLSSADAAKYSSIETFWPHVAKRLTDNGDQTEVFAALFRSLLRFRQHMKGVPSEDNEILGEVLGAERISVPGDPALTEESVDAYADMACFMYEQRHPGKTVDATDNRVIFASVIARKFTEAPSDKDRQAMANFALTWAKFKVAWMCSSAERKEQLLKDLESKTKSKPDDSEQLVDLILRTGPWN